MRRPVFSEALAFFLGLWLCAVGAWWLSRRANQSAESFPERLSAESVAGFEAIYFARTRRPFPPSGSEETIQGVRWRIHHAPSSGGKHRVGVTAESLPGHFTAEYSFERTLQ